jgi:hypothetical protein
MVHEPGARVVASQATPPANASGVSAIARTLTGGSDRTERALTVSAKRQNSICSPMITVRPWGSRKCSTEPTALCARVT